MTEDWQLLDHLFSQALDLEPRERTAFLLQVERDQPNLYAELCKLLLLDEQEDGFLDQSSPKLFSTLLGDFGTHAERPPLEYIGPYRILRELGRGGMGLVYLAQRDIDAYTHQTVALKVIKRGMDSDAIVHRFKQERAVLATLDHPHIARLIDGGTTDDGRPYFVMEYIKGQAITTYCDEYKLSVDERLLLFETVCEAVQYAHQRLIVHRDLKPSNILVTESGTVKLLDFGIAKVLDDKGAIYGDVVPLTLTGMRPLTPHYASPEQIQGDTITTASDVYALGVLLYELVVGQRPHAAKLRREVERVIVEQEVTRPSTAILNAVSALQDTDSTWILEARQMSAEQLCRRLRGDVDSIVLKALAKDVDRRYGSAQVLASDVRRHLAGLPIEARPDYMVYRVRKFVQRHQWSVAFTAVFVALMVGFSTFYTVQVTAERDRAEAEVEKTRVMNNFVADIFRVASGAGNPNVGDTLLAKTVLQEAARQLETITRSPQKSEVYALMKRNLSEALYELGRYSEGLALIQDVLAIQEELLDENDIELAHSLDVLGAYYTDLDSVEAVILIAEHALQIALRSSEKDNITTVVYYYFWASVAHQDAGDAEQGVHYLQEGLAYLQRFDPTRRRVQSLTADLYNDLASLYLDLDMIQEAEIVQEKAFAIMRPLVERYGHREPWYNATETYADILLARGKPEQALEMLDEALATVSRTPQPFTSFPLYGMKETRLNVLMVSGAYAEAARYAQVFLSALETRFGTTHGRVTSIYESYLQILRLQGAYDEADALVTTILERLEEEPELPSHTLAAFYDEQGILAFSQGDFVKAKELFTMAIEAEQRQPYTHAYLARTYLYLHKPDAAWQIIQEAFPTSQNSLVLTPTSRAKALLGLGEVLLHRQMPDSAATTVQRGLHLFDIVGWHANYASSLWGQSLLGQAYLQKGQYTKAESLLVATHTAMQEAPAISYNERRLTQQALFDLYTAWNKPEQATVFQHVP